MGFNSGFKGLICWQRNKILRRNLLDWNRPNCTIISAGCLSGFTTFDVDLTLPSEKSSNCGSLGKVTYSRTNLADCTPGLFQNTRHVSLLFGAHFKTSLDPNFCKGLNSQNTTYNSINSHTQDTTRLRPNIQRDSKRWTQFHKSIFQN